MAQTKKKKSITNLLSGAEKTVALDIGSRYVKLAVLQRRKNCVSAKQLDQMAIPFTSSRGDVTPEAVKETVKQLLQRNRIKDTGVLSVMSRDFVTVSHLELPSTEREQIKQMLVFEAESHLPFAMERAITAFDFKPIEQPKAEPKEGEEEAPAEPAPVMSKVVFAAVRQALIPKFLELHSQKGLKQTAIQVSSFTIFNLYDYLKREGKIPETDGDTMIIEMGARRTEFILVNGKGELVFTRNVEKGGDDLTAFLSAEEGISFEEAEQRKIKNWEETKLNDPGELLRAMEGLNAELDKTIRFLKNRGLSENITQVCVSGGGAARPEVCRALSAPLGIDAPLYLNGLEAIEAKGKDLFGPSFSAVLGAALAQIDEAAIYIDLLPVDVVKLQLLAMRRKMLIKLAIGVAAVALVALLILGIAVLISNAKVEAKNKELKSKLTETKKVDALEKRNQQLQKAVNDIEGVISRKTSWNSVLAGISSCMTSNLWITSIGVDKNNTMTVEGYSRNADYLLFEENMQRQLRFENVIVPSEKTMYQYGLQVHYFKLTCDILPDYKYNEKLRNLLNQPGSETGEAKEANVPATPATPANQLLERSDAPAETNEAKPEVIMEAPMQGTPLRLGTPAGGNFRGSSKVAEEPPKAEGQTETKAVSKPARSGRLMKRADSASEAEKAKPEAEETEKAVTENSEDKEETAKETPESSEETSVTTESEPVVKEIESNDKAAPEKTEEAVTVEATEEKADDEAEEESGSDNEEENDSEDADSEEAFEEDNMEDDR
ncbi:pilus assembly protein PilM [bacterium]|nr:pilus assembly protein PilM [bacterium]